MSALLFLVEATDYQGEFFVFCALCAQYFAALSRSYSSITIKITIKIYLCMPRRRPWPRQVPFHS